MLTTRRRSLRTDWLRDTRGAQLVEYILLLGLCALVALTGVRLFGGSVSAKILEHAQCVATLSCGPGVDGNQGSTDEPQLDIDSSVPAVVAEAARFSPSVRRAIETMNQYGVRIATGPTGGGSFFNPATNTVTLDPASGMDADTFVHEFNHARYHHTGQGADIMSMARQQYIDGMIAEEIDGSVQGAQAVYELLQAGQTVDRPPFFDAYERGVADGRRANPNASEAELMAAGREALRQRFHTAFYGGEFVTSTTQQPYPDYYGDAWDRAHPPPPRPWWRFW